MSNDRISEWCGANAGEGSSRSGEALSWYNDMIYDMIYLTAIGLTPGGNSTVHIYTRTIQRTTKSTQTIHRTTQFTNQEECRPCPVFARYTLAFAYTTEEKAWKNLSQGSRRILGGNEGHQKNAKSG